MQVEKKNIACILTFTGNKTLTQSTQPTEMSCLSHWDMSRWLFYLRLLQEGAVLHQNCQKNEWGKVIFTKEINKLKDCITRLMSTLITEGMEDRTAWYKLFLSKQQLCHWLNMCLYLPMVLIQCYVYDVVCAAKHTVLCCFLCCFWAWKTFSRL